MATSWLLLLLVTPPPPAYETAIMRMLTMLMPTRDGGDDKASGDHYNGDGNDDIYEYDDAD